MSLDNVPSAAILRNGERVAFWKPSSLEESNDDVNENGMMDLSRCKGLYFDVLIETLLIYLEYVMMRLRRGGIQHVTSTRKVLT